MADGKGGRDRARVSDRAAKTVHWPRSSRATEELERVAASSTGRSRWVWLQTGVRRLRRPRVRGHRCWPTSPRDGCR